jgi:hypothetical protein
MFGSFAKGETGPTIPVLEQETAYSIWLSLGILAKCPPDRFANEELLLVGSAQTVVEQSSVVGGRFVLQRRDQGCASQPHELIVDPRLDDGCHHRTLFQMNQADAMRRYIVDEVPPRPFDNELAIEIEILASDEPAVGLCYGYGEVLLLTMRLLPQSGDDCPVSCIVRDRESLLHSTEHLGSAILLDTVERHVGLHICSHADCLFRIGEFGEFCSDKRDNVVHVGTVPGAAISLVPRQGIHSSSVTTLRTLVLMIVLAVVAASCGGDDAATTTSELTTLAPVETTAATTTASSPSTTEATTTTAEGLTPSPLNGMGVEDPELLNRRVIAIKIDNHWDARPQSGIEQADAVYELLVEGGLTRFIALFHHSDTEYLGPVRSGRPTDPTLVKFLGAPLQISGAQPWVVSIILGDGVNLLGDTGATTFRIHTRSAPHNLYGSTILMREEADRRGYPDDPPAEPIFDFGDPTPGDPGAERINLDWSDNPIVHWEWTGTEYIRFNGDTPHTWRSAPVEGEEVVDTQIAMDTLVVLEAPKYWASSSNGAGSAVPALDTVGTGKAYVFYDGLVVEGQWQRDTIDERFELSLDDGTPIVVPAGRLWISVFPDNRPITWE